MKTIIFLGLTTSLVLFAGCAAHGPQMRTPSSTSDADECAIFNALPAKDKSDQISARHLESEKRSVSDPSLVSDPVGYTREFLGGVLHRARYDLDALAATAKFVTPP